MTDWQAGPDLDFEIARRVFGAEERPCHVEGHCDRMHWYYPDGTVEIQAPSYSEDIACAWLVVEKMRERGFYVTLQGNPIKHETGYPCHVFTRTPKGQRRLHGVALEITAPLAICRAALSVGVR